MSRLDDGRLPWKSVNSCAYSSTVSASVFNDNLLRSTRASAFLHHQMEGYHLSLVLNDPMFWFLIAVHCFLLYLDGHMLENGGDGLPTLDWQASTVAMGLLTFFLVFYGTIVTVATLSYTAIAYRSKGK